MAIVLGGACSLRTSGLGPAGEPDDAAARDQGADMPGGRDQANEGSTVSDVGGPPMPPTLAGCADGTREGFFDTKIWPDLAGCSGAWSEPGVLGDAGRVPQCGRKAGDDGANAPGAGCAAADLCADGWHVCRGPTEVAKRSLSGCEGSTLSGEKVFFAASYGSAPTGICAADPGGTNNLYGCGNLGAPTDQTCLPLDRLMSFTDCGAYEGWSCGASADWLREAQVVTKSTRFYGGVLCCRDR